MSAARRHEAPLEPGLRPVCIAVVDLDLAPTDLVFDPGTKRVWVEARRRGQVVGVAELAPRAGVVAARSIEALAASLPDDGPRPVDTVADDRLAFASVVVPTICRDPGSLVRTIQSLVDLDYPAFEVLVVDNRAASSPPLPMLPGGSKVRVLTEPRRGISHARNCGVAAAVGAFVAFTDDDAEVDTRWLRALGARFAADPHVDALGGLVLPKELGTEPQLWFEEFYGGFSQSFRAATWSMALVGDDDALFPYAPGRFGAGCNMALRRDALARVGAFDVELGAGSAARGGEDLAMFVRCVASGAAVGFEPSALVRHSHRRTQREFFAQVFDYGVGLTAMYTSLVVHDRRHLGEMLRRIPGGIRLLLRPRDERSPSAAPSYPRRTILYQLLGMSIGPAAYLRARRRQGRRP